MIKYLKILSLFIIVLNVSIYAQAINEIVSSIKSSEEFKNASWGIYAEFTDNGEVIINFDGYKSLAPASGLKIFTSSAALNYLGEDFRFTTDLYVKGNVSNEGTLDGDLIIRGGGDPTLGSVIVKGSLPLDTLMQVWSEAVKAAGIKKIDGSVISDDFLFDRVPLPDYYPWIDMGNYYGAGTSALTIHDNLYFLYFKPGNPGEPAEILRTYPVIPKLSFI
ncbi:MAG: hypothetical protein EHM47_15180, partial [Ignavibacteriales bacterium]